MALIDATQSNVFLWDAGEGALVPYAWHGFPDTFTDIANTRMHLGEGAVGRVAERREGMIVNDYQTWPDAHQGAIQRTGVTAILAEPLCYRDRLVGVLMMQHNRAGLRFTEEDQETVRLLAGQAAIAIANAQLFDAVQRELAERKRAEERLSAALQQLHDIIEFLPDPTFVIGRDREVIAWNQAIEQLTGAKAEEMLGQGDYAYAVPFYGERRPMLMDLLDRASPELEDKYAYVRRVGDKVYAETHIPHLNRGSGAHLWAAAAPLYDAGGRQTGAIEVIRDITERRQAEDALRASLREKDVLLREVHHRVKNNMQIISSLLRLQSRRLKTPEVQEIFRESQNRVRSMALVHELLYQSKDLAQVNLRTYFKALAQGLYRAYGGHTARIALAMDVDEILVGVDMAIPCGLVVGELLSNALKHAFPERQAGTIQLRAHPTGENAMEVVVKDDGVGMDLVWTREGTESLGLRLVHMLAEEQLHGTVQISRHDGTECCLRFPMEKR